jgi:hypothetical protein
LPGGFAAGAGISFRRRSSGTAMVVAVDASPPPHPVPVRRRRWRARLVVLLVVLALLVGVDRLVVVRTQSVVSQAVAADVGSPVQVRVGGVLAGLRLLLTDRIEVVQLEAQAVPLPDIGVVIDHLSVEVTDLRLGADDRPVAGDGRFRAAFGQAQVRAAAPAELRGLLQLDADGLRIDAGLAAVPLEVSVVGAALEIGLPGEAPLLDALLGDSVRVPLDVPDGVVVVDAAVEDGQVVLSGVLDPVVVAG